MEGKYLLSSVVFCHQRDLGSSIRMKEERLLKLRIAMMKVVVGNTNFANELLWKCLVILGPQDKICMCS